MLRVGLTGGIASGKSVVGEMFVKRGVHLILADAVAHRLMEPGQAVYEEVVRRFGRGILNPDSRINRPLLAQMAFGDPGRDTPPRVKELNAIVHPAVVRYENDWMDDLGRRDPEAIAMVEAALILEAGVADRFDRIIVVVCENEQRIARLAQRMKLSEREARAEVARRMAAQLPDEEKIKAADVVIDNSGSVETTEEQVERAFASFQQAIARQS